MRPGDGLGGGFPASAALRRSIGGTHFCFPVVRLRSDRFGAEKISGEMKKKRGVWFDFIVENERL